MHRYEKQYWKSAGMHMAYRRKSANYYAMKSFMSSSTVPMPGNAKFSTSTFATLGDRKPGSVGTEMDVLHTQIQESQKPITAFCSYPGNIEHNRQLVNIIKSENFFSLSAMTARE